MAPAAAPAAPPPDGVLPTTLPFTKRGAKPQGTARQTHFKKLKQMVAYDVELAANERVAAGRRKKDEGEGGDDYVPWCPCTDECIHECDDALHWIDILVLVSLSLCVCVYL